MNLSNSGRVVIIDDKYDEIQQLIELFGKDYVPYIYLDGSLEHLPKKPFTGIRFVIMDIELSEGFKGQDLKTKASSITAVLERIVSKQNGPYVLIAWTKHTEVIEQVVKNCSNLSIHPVQTLDLDKMECLNTNDIMGHLTQKLNDELEKIGAFQLYVDWENMVNSAAKEFISKFSSFYPIDDKWSERTEHLFYKLYKTYVEKNELSDKNEQIRCSFHLLNRSYLDTLENKTAMYSLPNSFQLAGRQIDKNIIAKLNYSLFIIENPTVSQSPGSIYHVENDENLLKLLKKDVFFDKKSNSDEDFTLCKMIITPECDIAQKKNITHRLIYGVLYRESSEIKPKNSQDIFKVGPIWYKKEEEEGIYQIIFSFQTITSSSSDKIDDEKRLFAVKRDLLFDIQSKAANHVNRLGNFQLK